MRFDLNTFDDLRHVCADPFEMMEHHEIGISREQAEAAFLYGYETFVEMYPMSSLGAEDCGRGSVLFFKQLGWLTAQREGWVVIPDDIMRRCRDD